MIEEGIPSYVARQIDTDDEDEFESTERIVSAYKSAPPECQSVIDDIFISLCGWSLDTIIKHLVDMELISDDGKIKVEFVNLGEGISGDYDPDDPEDENLLRFDVSVKEGDEWVDPGDASYCTQMPADTKRIILTVALRHIMSEVEDPLRSGDSIKKICERLSWMNPDWYFKKGELIWRPDTTTNASGE